MKKVSLVLLGALLILCLTFIPKDAKADTEGYFTYEVSGGKATITDVDPAASGNLILPDTLGGYPVTQMAASLSQCDQVTTLTISAGIIYIDPDTIAYAPALEQIVVAKENKRYTSDSSGVLYTKNMREQIAAPRMLAGSYTVPDGVVKVGSFFRCGELTQIILPESVTEISYYGFLGCEKLESVNIPSGVQKIMAFFAYCTSLKEVTIPYGVTTIPEGTFLNCTSLEYVELPETVTDIEMEAFYGCTSLKTIDLSHVTYIGESAFDSCESLTGEIVLAEGLTELDVCAFYGCKSLRSIRLPESLTVIEGNAFGECDSLEELYIPAGVTYVGVGSAIQKAYRVAEDNPYYTSDKDGILFDKEMTRLVSVPREISGCYTVPAGVVEIGRYSFKDCKKLTGVILPEGVVSIGEFAFDDCANLESVEVPETLTTVETAAFRDCISLREVPDFTNVKSLSYLLFSGCTEFVSVIVPEGVEQISSYAFEECVNMTDISLPSTLKSVEMRAFEKCTALKSVITPIGGYIIDIDDWGETNRCFREAQWEGHTWKTPQYTVQPTCKVFGQLEIVCIDCGYTLRIRVDTVEHIYSEGYTAKSYGHYHPCIVCGGLGTGGPHKFVDSVCTECGYVQQSGTSTTTPSTPTQNTPPPIKIESVTYYIEKGQAVVMACDQNAEGAIVIQQTVDGYPVTKIDEDAFKECAKITEVFIPQGVTKISDGAFYGCEKLGSIIIPDSVRNIGNYAFCYCLKLAEVSLPNHLKKIGVGTFEHCESLKSITLPDALVTISHYAFASCIRLTDVVIPRNVSDLGVSVFLGCSNIKNLVVDADNPYLSADAYGVLYNKERTTLLQAPGSIKEKYEIPAGVTAIESHAFEACRDLTEIVIPETVLTIRQLAFDGCVKLCKVQYTGTEQQWSRIVIESNKELETAERVFADTSVETMPTTVTQPIQTPVETKPATGQNNTPRQDDSSWSILIAVGVTAIIAAVVSILIKRRK